MYGKPGITGDCLGGFGGLCSGGFGGLGCLGLSLGNFIGGSFIGGSFIGGNFIGGSLNRANLIPIVGSKLLECIGFVFEFNKVAEYP